MPERFDVAVIGAGLAGLTCARDLTDQGRSVVVFDANPAVGGRVRSDHVDGFILDRGFQVLLTGYPAAKRRFDYQALDLQAFAPGVRIHVDGDVHRIGDPFREPTSAFATLRAPIFTINDLARLMFWRRAITRPSGQTLAHRGQGTTAQLFAALRFSPRSIERFFQPFLAGVFFDPDLSTSSRLTELVFRSFFTGDVAIPAGGMGALSAQLAAPISQHVRLNTRIVGIDETADQVVVALADGDTVHADQVVVATDPPNATALFPDGQLGHVAPGLGTTTVYYVADEAPAYARTLDLGVVGEGPITTCAVLTNIAPSYAPSGKTLISVSLLGVGHDATETDQTLRHQLATWYSPEVAHWQQLAVYEIAYAQPRQQPNDLAVMARDVKLTPRLYVAGDHRDTGTIQGALVSGRRAAQAVLTETKG